MPIYFGQGNRYSGKDVTDSFKNETTDLKFLILMLNLNKKLNKI